jgi:hypothetical protein
MGGFGSGRYGGWPTVESGLTLDLYKLIRDGLLRPGQSSGGTLIWSYAGTGERVGSIGYLAILENERGRMHLTYTSTYWDGTKHDSDYWVELTTRPQPFGGRRWWFVCPKTGALVAKLHLPPGAFTFASRRAYRLAYKSQRETPHDRAIRRAFKLRHRLGAEGGIGDYIAKPKWMRWATFDREMAKVEDAEAIVNGHLWVFVQKLGGRIGR